MGIQPQQGASDFETNVITVDKTVGAGDFTSFAAAVNSITDSSETKRYLIQGGVGDFVEPLIDLTNKPYVSIKGSAIQTTKITPDSSSHHVFSIGAFNELSFMWIEGAGSGYAGINVSDIGNYAQAHKVTFLDCDINVLVTSATQDTIFYGEYLDFNGAYSYGVKCIATNGFQAFANLENYYNFPTDAIFIAGTYCSGVGARAEIITAGNEGTGVGDSIYVEDGGEININAVYISGFDNGITIANIGDAPKLTSTSTQLSNNTTWDLSILHPTAIVQFNGSSSHIKVNNQSANTVWAFLDVDDNEFEITGKLYTTFSDGTHTDTSALIFESGTMGLIEGGQLADGNGFDVDVLAGFGYVEQYPQTGIIEKKEWGNHFITLGANEDKYIFINNNGILSSNGSRPDTKYNILLGRVVTNGTGIELILEGKLNAEHTSNRFDDLFVDALGSIYAYGSTVTENGTAFKLDVTAGEYFFSTNKFNPSGGTIITFTPTLGGVIQTPTTIVNNIDYDVAGVLTPIPMNKYVKHSLYVSGEDGYEKYFLVYATDYYNNGTDAENAAIPLPPAFVRGSVVLIAGIVIQEGHATIYSITDQRPVIGFRGVSVSGSSDHLALTNLTTGDAGHTQFMMLDGSTAMANDLDLGGNDLTNVNLVDGYYLSDFYIKGTNAFGANQTIGLSDNYSLGIKTNNIERISIANGGGVTVSNLSNASTEVIGATSTGLLTRSVTTANLSDSTNKRYVTDAELVVLGNTSGTNTGDNATNSQYSGLASSKQDTLVSGTNIKTVNGNSLVGSGNVSVGNAFVTDPLSQFASTTSLQLKSVISDETGSGALVFADSPVLVTPNLGTPSTLVATNATGTASSLSIGGNAATATVLETARDINGVSFNGSANITVTADANTLTGTTLKSTVVSSSLTSVGTLTNLTVSNTISGSVNGNANTATTLQTPRTINGTSFDGSANITVTSDAGTLTGATLNATVTSSSLTSFGANPAMTSPAITTSITTASTTFTAFAGATTLLTIGGTGASAVLNIPSTLEQSSTTGALTVQGGVYIAKRLNAAGSSKLAGVRRTTVGVNSSNLARTLSGADMASGTIFELTGATGRTFTMDTGTALSTAVPDVQVGDAIQFIIKATGAVVTMAGATGTTLTTSSTIAAGTSRIYTAVNTGTNTWTIY